MSYTAIATAEIQVGEPLKQELFQKIKDNFDYFSSLIGGQFVVILVNASSAIVSDSNTLLYASLTGAVTTTLPDAAISDGQIFAMKKDTSPYVWTIASGGGTFDGETNLTLNRNNEFILVISDGTNWRVISDSSREKQREFHTNFL